MLCFVQAFKRSLEGETPPPIDRSPSHGVADPPSDHKAAITLGVIMGVFLVCWTPFFTANIIVAFCEHCVPNSVYHVVTWLGYFNSSLNPVIYPIFNQDFRRSFSRLLAPLFVCSSNSRVNGIVSGGGGGGRRGISSVPPHRHTSCLPRVVHVGESASIWQIAHARLSCPIYLISSWHTRTLYCKALGNTLHTAHTLSILNTHKRTMKYPTRLPYHFVLLTQLDHSYLTK